MISLNQTKLQDDQQTHYLKSADKAVNIAHRLWRFTGVLAKLERQVFCSHKTAGFPNQQAL